MTNDRAEESHGSCRSLPTVARCARQYAVSGTPSPSPAPNYSYSADGGEHATCSETPTLGRYGLSFTVSVGMTAVEPKHKRDGASKLEDLLRAADRGLYASKRRGGDHATAAAVSSVMTTALGAQTDGKYDIH